MTADDYILKSYQSSDRKFITTPNNKMCTNRVVMRVWLARHLPQVERGAKTAV